MYARRRYSRFSRKSRKSAVSRIARGRVGKAKPAITKLAKAVKRLQLSNKADHEPIMVGYKEQQSIIQPYNTFRLTPNGAWSDIFGSSGADWNQANKITWKSTGFDMYFTQQSSVNDEEEITTYTVFLVKLTKEASELLPTSSSAVNTVGGAGALGATLVDGVHFHSQSTGLGNIGAGLVLLNKKYFKILRTKRFVLGNFGQALNISAGQRQYGNDYRLYWKVAPRKLIAPPGGNAQANSHRDPHDQYYVLVFSSNSNVDTENPQMYISAVSTLVPHN